MREEAEHKILTCGRRAGNAKKLLQSLYQRPMVGVKEVVDLLKISNKSATKLIKDFDLFMEK